MNANEIVSNCYTHSREFTHAGHMFRIRINDDRMTYTATVLRDGEVVARRTDLGPETAGFPHAAIAADLLG